MSPLFILLIWLICSGIVMVGFGAIGLMSFDAELSDLFTRRYRITAVLLGPVTIAYFIFTKVPIISVPWLLFKTVMLKK